MATQVVFCSARDRNVTLVPRSPDWTWHIILSRQLFGDVACVDQGRSCTGALCPFSAEAANAAELEEAGELGAGRPN